MIQSFRQGHGMPVRRSRQSRRSDSGYTVSDAGAVLTILQVVVCVILLVSVFTLQFLNGEQYEKAGELYRAVMKGNAGEALFVGAFGTPITKELLENYAVALLPEKPSPSSVSSAPVESKAPTPPEQPRQGGQGGETPDLPPNLYLGRVLLSAPPVYPAYGVITSPFGVRIHPISQKADFHTGLDIAAPMGASIYAVLPGRVSAVGYSSVYGNYLRLTHGSGLETVYNHCSEILAHQGAVVRQGERIALVGSTGVSTGTHLHFDLLVNGCYADPLQVFA